MFNLLHLGHWRRGQVECVWTTSTFAPTPGAQQRIEAAWRTAAARPGAHLYDGPMCRLESIAHADNRLLLSLSPTNYRAFVGTNMAHGTAGDSCDASQLANPLGLSVALESADGCLLLGRRNDCVAYYPGYVHPFAGTLEPAANVDVFADALRELEEEVSVAADEITDMSLVAIVADDALRQPELIFRAKTSRDGAAIRQRLNPAEHCDVVECAPARLDAALADVSTWTPVAVAAAMLFGRDKLGPEWFGKAVERMRLGRLTT